VTWAAADHRPVLAEQPSCDNVLERDREAGVKVGVGSGCSEAVAQPQLLDCRGGGVGRHLDAAADNAPPEEVALEVDTALEALGKQARDRGLPAAIGPVMR
jgi:hypothetical protein